MPRPTTEQHLLLEQVQHIARGLGETLAPFCEVVVHDLLHPEHAILSIHNNQSGREVGAPATELGLARIADPEFPQVLANYANRYADGRRPGRNALSLPVAGRQYRAQSGQPLPAGGCARAERDRWPGRLSLVR